MRCPSCCIDVNDAAKLNIGRDATTKMCSNRNNIQYSRIESNKKWIKIVCCSLVSFISPQNRVDMSSNGYTHISVGRCDLDVQFTVRWMIFHQFCRYILLRCSTRFLCVWAFKLRLNSNKWPRNQAQLHNIRLWRADAGMKLHRIFSLDFYSSRVCVTEKITATKTTMTTTTKEKHKDIDNTITSGNRMQIAWKTMQQDGKYFTFMYDWIV